MTQQFFPLCVLCAAELNCECTLLKGASLLPSGDPDAYRPYAGLERDRFRRRQHRRLLVEQRLGQCARARRHKPSRKWVCRLPAAGLQLPPERDAGDRTADAY